MFSYSPDEWECNLNLTYHSKWATNIGPLQGKNIVYKIDMNIYKRQKPTCKLHANLYRHSSDFVHAMILVGQHVFV